VQFEFNPNPGDIANAALKSSKSLIFTENVLYSGNSELNRVSRFDPLVWGFSENIEEGVAVPRTGRVTENA
jgi:hypothetical protein